MKKLFLILLVSMFFENSFGQTETKQTFILGQPYGGGIIFYVDPNGQHGLIAAPNDQWGYGCWGKEGWTGANFMNDGALNTKLIVPFIKNGHKVWQPSSPSAACMCDSSTLGGYTDWYLPSINELKSIYDKQLVIGAFAAGDYVSSTESDRDECWCIHFKPNNRFIYHYHKIWGKYNVRCIRKF
jgi:hypothetical protein